jgi:hypothetical protein
MQYVSSLLQTQLLQLAITIETHNHNFAIIQQHLQPCNAVCIYRGSEPLLRLSLQYSNAGPQPPLKPSPDPCTPPLHAYRCTIELVLLNLKPCTTMHPGCKTGTCELGRADAPCPLLHKWECQHTSVKYAQVSPATRRNAFKTKSIT